MAGKCSTWATALPLGMVIENWFCSLKKTTAVHCWRLFMDLHHIHQCKRDTHLCYRSSSVLGLDPRSSVSTNTGALARKTSSQDTKLSQVYKVNEKDQQSVGLLKMASMLFSGKHDLWGDGCFTGSESQKKLSLCGISLFLRQHFPWQEQVEIGQCFRACADSTK